MMDTIVASVLLDGKGTKRHMTSHIMYPLFISQILDGGSSVSAGWQCSFTHTPSHNGTYAAHSTLSKLTVSISVAYSI